MACGSTVREPLSCSSVAVNSILSCGDRVLPAHARGGGTTAECMVDGILRDISQVSRRRRFPAIVAFLACERREASVCCILPYVEESGTGHSRPLDGSADTFGGWGYLLRS